MPERKWVFDTVSLSNFLFSDSIDIIVNRYEKRAVITSQVYDEISAGMAVYPELKHMDDIINQGILKLSVLSTQERKLYYEVIGNLGKGEASCIAYAQHQSAIVVTDDRAARRHCSQMSIPFTGSIGILKAACLHGQVTAEQADSILGKMIQSGFYSPVQSIYDIL